MAERVAALPFRPGLRVSAGGEDPASVVYVRNKDRAAAEVGFDSATLVLPAETPEAVLLAEIARLNADPAVDGILVQLPLPPQIRPQAVLDAIDPAKDVDGFHPLNAGLLATGRPGLVPCTPRGVMHLLAEAGVALPGARVKIIGRSTIVGRPLAQLLIAADATVDGAALPHARSAGGMPPGGGSGSGRRAGGTRARGLDRRRSGGDRCRHQPPAGWPAGRRCRLRRGRRPRRRHHPCAWLGWGR